MEAVSEGDLSTSIHLKGRDETVRLAQTFNQMIADLKSSRDALEKMNRELDLKVKERTAQLEEQNLKVKEAQEALLRTTRLASIGEIAGRTAHEVLNPLTSLLTRAGLMQKRVLNDYQSQLGLLDEIRRAWEKDFREGGFAKLTESWNSPSTAQPGKTLFEEDLANLQAIAADLGKQSKNIDGDTQFIREEGNRIGKIINSMRRLGHVRSDARKHSLHSILGDCCHIMADLFDQKNFRIEKRFEAEHDLVHADRDELIQAVTNLMRNSYQALEDMGRGAKGRMSVRTYNRGEEILVEIEDNGAGIPAADQARLFEASFTTKPADEGTGLGLGISRRFARSYGGDIEFVSSIEKQSTVFRIRMPLQAQGKTGAVA
jgi:signal transduction histidine kinase